MICSQPQEAAAFEVNTTQAGRIQFWDISMLPLSWWSNTNAARGISTEDTITAWKQAMHTWTLPSCSSFRSLYRGVTSATLAADRVNVLYFSPLSSFPSVTLAVTTTTFDPPTGRLLDADIAFRNTVVWSIRPSAQEYDLVGTATHEVGHLLGLAHSSVRGATMADKAATGLNPQRQLSQDDINGVCFLYPRGQRAYAGHGLPCGNASQGAGCPPGYLCVARAGSSQAYCVSRCQQGNCENRGFCTQTTTGNEFCTCDSDNQCPPSSRCLSFNCWETSPPCRFDGDCEPGKQCQNQRCVARNVGTCFSDQDCPEGGCTQGRCPTTNQEVFPDANPQESPASQEPAVQDAHPAESSEHAADFSESADSTKVTEQTSSEDSLSSDPLPASEQDLTSPENVTATGCQCNTPNSWPLWGWLVVVGLLWLRRSQR